MNTTVRNGSMNEMHEYVLERTFDAPRHLVWKAWTDREMLSHWYGPGVDTIIHELDVRPGGQCLIEMKWGENSMYQRVDYTDVEFPARLVWLQCVSDNLWNTIANPMMPSWPVWLHTAVTFRENGDMTDVQLIWQPHEASEDEIANFSRSIYQLDKGWQKGMSLLEQMLEVCQRTS